MTLLLAAAMGGCVAEPAAPPREPARVEPAPAPLTMAVPTPAEPPKAAEPKIVVPPPEKLLGMGRAEIVKIFGEPTFRRHDVPALLMRYRDTRCILDLFLYPPTGTDTARAPAVEHVEARRIDGSGIATRACIDSVMRSRAAEPRG